MVHHVLMISASYNKTSSYATDVVTAEFTEQRDPRLATHSSIGGTEETGSY